MDTFIAEEQIEKTDEIKTLYQKIKEIKTLCQKIKNKIFTLEDSIQNSLYKMENENSSHSDDSY